MRNNAENTAIVPFLYGETTIRTLERDGAPWFVAKDVCQVLGLQNVADSVNANEKNGTLGLDSCEKGIVILDTLGGKQSIIIINEPGLYRLIFKSRKAEARAFQRWVFTEVLPAIRRTGCYNPGHTAYLALIADAVALGVSPNLAARAALKLTAGVAARVATARHAPPPVDLGTRYQAELVALMRHGEIHTTRELRGMLPAGHPLRTKLEESDITRIGILMAKAAAGGLIERISGRNMGYRLSNPDNIVSL